jgi:hypothetical protein
MSKIEAHSRCFLRNCRRFSLSAGNGAPGAAAILDTIETATWFQEKLFSSQQARWTEPRENEP